MADFYIKRGDLLPAMTSTLESAPGAAQDLTGATVVFRFQPAAGGTVRSFACVITDVATGRVQYNWQVGDTDFPGPYIGEFVATFAGKEISYPSVGFLNILISPDVA